MKVGTLGLVGAAFVSAAALQAPPAEAHNWGCYRQPDRTVRTYITASRSAQATAAVNEWSVDTILNLPLQNSHTNISVFDGNYGNTGWAGLASIESLSGCLILHGHARVNLYYASSYTSNGIRGIFCQEVGHLFGLDHSNDGGCMGGGYFYSINTYYTVVSHNINDIANKYANVPALADAPEAGADSADAPPDARAFWHSRPRSVADALGLSDAVVVARVADVTAGEDLVVSLREGTDRAEDRIPTERVTFEVTQALAGRIGPTFELFHTGNAEYVVDEDPAYAAGQEYVLFVTRREDGSYRVIAPEGRFLVQRGRLVPAAREGFAGFLRDLSVQALFDDLAEAFQARATR